MLLFRSKARYEKASIYISVVHDKLAGSRPQSKDAGTRLLENAR